MILACLLNAVLCGIFLTYIAQTVGGSMGFLAFIAMLINIAVALAEASDGH